jgi:uncharacterized protein (DUF433 family)
MIVQMDDHPEIVFREGTLGRRAILAGTRLDVWQIVETVRSSGDSIETAAEYLGLPRSRVEAAVDYYAAHRDEVDRTAEREHVAAEHAEAAWRAGREPRA